MMDPQVLSNAYSKIFPGVMNCQTRKCTFLPKIKSKILHSFLIYVRILNLSYTKSSRVGNYLAGYKAFLSLKSSLASSFSSYISFCWSVNWSLYFLHYKIWYVKTNQKLSSQSWSEAAAPQPDVCLLLKIHILCMLLRWLSLTLRATLGSNKPWRCFPPHPFYVLLNYTKNNV